MTEPKKARILKSVRWEADIFEQLEVKAKSVGGFNALIVNQRAKLTRQPGISALNFDHPG